MFKLMLSKLFNKVDVRLLLVLFALIVAALVGGAPNELGGG